MCGAEVGEECRVLQAQEHEKIANLMPVKEVLPEAVLELEDFRTLSCSLGGYQVSWASSAHGDTWAPAHGSLAPAPQRCWE